MESRSRMCAACGKVSFPNRGRARQAALDVCRRSGDHLEAYDCTREPGTWHLRDIDKRILKFSAHANPASLAEVGRLRLEKSALANAAHRVHVEDPDSEVEATRASTSVGYALWSVPVIGQKRVQRHNGFRWTRRYRNGRREARVDLPQGGTVMKMLAWANGATYDRRDTYPRYRGDELRRRNRKREKAVYLRELHGELSDVKPGPVFEHAQEYEVTLPKVWRDLADEADIVRTLPLDYDGSWTCG